VDNLDSSLLIFRATEMMTAKTRCRDFDASFPKLSKWDGHVTPSQWSSWGTGYELPYCTHNAKHGQMQISCDIAEWKDLLLWTQ
jgi:hypothetical protein